MSSKLERLCNINAAPTTGAQNISLANAQKVWSRAQAGLSCPRKTYAGARDSPTDTPKHSQEKVTVDRVIWAQGKVEAPGGAYHMPTCCYATH